MIIKIKKRYFNDVLVFLQKKYKLYFVEFRQGPNGRKNIVLCRPNSKDWWICIFINTFSIEVLVVNAGQHDIHKTKVIHQLNSGEYKGYSRNYVNKWKKL